MIDLQHIRNNINHEVFYCNSPTSKVNAGWQTWTKPRNAKLVSIVAIGGGGGGGGNRTGQLRGGGGGGSGAVTKLIIPANLLPDNLFLSVGRGGTGGGNALFGRPDDGEISYVCITPEIVSGSVVIQSGDVEAKGGQQGAGAGTALGGAGGTAFTYDPTSALSVFYCALGIFQSTPGARGGDGSTALASNITALSASILTGGAGGSGNSGASAAGASITGVGLVPTIPGGTSGGGSGSAGYQTYRPDDLVSQRVPFLATGGAGGSSDSTSLNGGNGGNGATACGGGGGGAGNSIGGSGGRGGDGVIIITTHF